MKAKTICALQVCTVKERWPVFSSYTENVSMLADEAVKHKKEWLTQSNVYSIFLSEVTSTLRVRFPDDNALEGKLEDILEGDAVTSLADKIVAIIASIPRSYIFNFPLPNVQIPIEGRLQLGEGVFLRSIGKGEVIPGGERKGLLGIFGAHLDRNKVYLCIEDSGFTSGDIDDIVFSHALSKFKILTYLLRIRGVFAERNAPPILYGLGGESHYVPNLFSTVFDSERESEVHASTLLPIGISRQTDKLYLNENNGDYQKANTEGYEAVKKYVQSVSRHPMHLLKHEGIDSVPVRSAIEWAYEASTTDNDTIAFIQVCIGLEAILGEDIGDESITSTLADRCAYLLGDDMQGRRTIRESFKEVYRRRSKLAHGRAIRLQPDELRYFKWAKSVLDLLISKEMKHLNLGKT